MGIVFFGSVWRVGDVYVTQTKSGGLEADSPPPSRYGESGGPWMGLASPIAGPLDPDFEPDSLNRGRGPRFSESTRDALNFKNIPLVDYKLVYVVTYVNIKHFLMTSLHKYINKTYKHMQTSMNL